MRRFLGHTSLDLLSFPYKLPANASPYISSTFRAVSIVNSNSYVYMPLLKRQFASATPLCASPSPTSAAATSSKLSSQHSSSASRSVADIMTQLHLLQLEMSHCIPQLKPGACDKGVQQMDECVSFVMFDELVRRRWWKVALQLQKAMGKTFALASELPNGEGAIPLNLWRVMIEGTQVMNEDSDGNKRFRSTTYKMYERMLTNGKKRPDAALLDYMIDKTHFEFLEICKSSDFYLKDNFVINLVDDAVSANPELLTEALLKKMMLKLEDSGHSASRPLCDYILKTALKHFKQYRGDYALMLKSNPMYLKCAVRKHDDAVDTFLQHATNESADASSIDEVLLLFGYGPGSRSVYAKGPIEMMRKWDSLTKNRFISFYKYLNDHGYLQSDVLSVTQWTHIIHIVASNPEAGLLPMVYNDRVGKNTQNLSKDEVELIGHAFFKYQGEKPAELVQIFKDMKKRADKGYLRQLEKLFKFAKTGRNIE